MKSHNTYSNEDISAYIDGELDSEERALILFDEQADAALAQRINDARILKEKVQLTFLDIRKKDNNEKLFNSKIFAGYHKSIAASLLLLVLFISLFTYNLQQQGNLITAKQLIKNTPVISAHKIDDFVGDHKRIVINLSQYQSENFDDTLYYIEKLLKDKSSSLFMVEIIANKQGLKALDVETSSHAERMSQLDYQFDNMKIIACAKSLASLAEKGDPIQLLKSIMITPSAAKQVARRTSEGWLYLKI